MINNTRILETSLKNLKESLTGWSMDEFILSTIESLMNVERSEYLAQAKSGDKGNGFYLRAFKSFSRNCLRINIPRTRSGMFSPNTLELVKLGQEQMNDLVLSLYKKGMTSRDISDLVKQLFGDSVSATKVTNLSKIFNEFRLAWENTKLDSYYKVVFCDCLFITVRRGDSYSNEAVYVAYGVKNDNTRELLALSINPVESATEWGEIFDDLKKKRGIKMIDLIVADGLPGLENEVHRVFPKTMFQKCVVHKMRNILNKTRPKDKAEMATDLKELFNNFSENDAIKKALKKVDIFIQKWKNRYPNIAKFFKEGRIEYYFTYIEFHPEVRRMIYTTNSIENLNRIIRKATKNKLSFEKPEYLLDYVFMIIKEFEEKNFQKYPVTNYAYFKLINC
ncbi:MAG: IS256 family transposase [Candidatus Uhrbacteria bacterium]|nr:IS256 family transposase [Candidatus Uhrbacteria bacterium]